VLVLSPLTMTIVLGGTRWWRLIGSSGGPPRAP